MLTRRQFLEQLLAGAASKIIFDMGANLYRVEKSPVRALTAADIQVYCDELERIYIRGFPPNTILVSAN